jgi:hypothetical protein
MKILYAFLFLSLNYHAKAQFTVIHDPNVQSRSVGAFHAVTVSSGIDLFLSQADEESLAVSAVNTKSRDNVKTQVENGELNIWYEGGLFDSGEKKRVVYLSFKDLDKLNVKGSDVFITGTIHTRDLYLTLSGASDFHADFEADTLTIEQDGASDARVSGFASELNVRVSGASNLDGYELKTEECNARASGASNINIAVSRQLSATAHSAGSIHYRGSPEIIQLNTSSAGSVKKED